MISIERKYAQKIYNNLQPYQHNVVILKDYNGKRKLTLHKTLKTKGVECDRNYSPKGSINEEKTDNNIKRAKSRIHELVLCNPWQWFFTITLDPDKYDRNDLEKFRKDFSQFIRNHNRLHNKKIKYLVVPEEHSKGGWHMHGFLMGLDASDLRLFRLDEKLPYYILNKLKKGAEIYEWEAYRKKFGFNDFEPIKNKEAAAFYVTKYITKDLERTVKESGAHLYYSSQGLSRAKEIKRGSFAPNVEFSWQFENDYIATSWLDDSFNNELGSAFLDNIILENISISEFKKQVADEIEKNRRKGLENRAIREMLNGFESLEEDSPF